jgi:hypothetical protein
MKKTHLWEMQYMDDEGDQVLLATNNDLEATINFACGVVGRSISNSSRFNFSHKF